MKQRIEEKIDKYFNESEERVDEGMGKFFEKIKDMIQMKALAPILKAVDNKKVLQFAVESWEDPKHMNAKISDIEGYKEVMKEAKKKVEKGEFNNLYELMEFMMDAYYKKRY